MKKAILAAIFAAFALSSATAQTYLCNRGGIIVECIDPAWQRELEQQRHEEILSQQRWLEQSRQWDERIRRLDERRRWECAQNPTWGC